MLNVAVWGSGRGSNFRALLTSVQQGSIKGVTIGLVLSNNSSAGILDIARGNGIPAVHLSVKQFPSEDLFVSALTSLMHKHKINFIVLAGYMKRVPLRVIQQFRERIINIHPALLPKFGGPGMYGIHVHEAVLAAGERESGATVHMVDEEYDHGRILAQQTVPVLDGDTPGILAARILEVEHRLLPATLHTLATSAKGYQ